MEKNKIRMKKFYNYTVYEDGTIINQHGKQIKTYREDRKVHETRLIIGEGRKNISIPRLLYHLFVEKIELYDKNITIFQKDGDSRNISLDNLQKIVRKGYERKELNDKRRLERKIYKRMFKEKERLELEKNISNEEKIKLKFINELLTE